MFAKHLNNKITKMGIHYGWIIVFLAFLTTVSSSAALSTPQVLIVPITSLNLLRNIIVDTNKLKQMLSNLNVDIIYVFTLETINSKANIHSRALAPRLGISEDPATGSAAGCIGAYLFKHNILSNEVCKKIYIEQGYEMMRPGKIFVEIDESTTIQVGGNTKLVFKGDLYLKHIQAEL